MERRVFSFRQWSDRLGGQPSQWTLARLAEKKAFRTIRIGKRVFVPLAEVERVEAEGATFASTRDTNTGASRARSGGDARKH